MHTGTADTPKLTWHRHAPALLCAMSGPRIHLGRVDVEALREIARRYNQAADLIVACDTGAVVGSRSSHGGPTDREQRTAHRGGRP